MVKRILLVCIALCAAFILGAIAFAQGPPPVDIGERHGNMRDAQQLIRQAWEAVDRAQQDNNYNLGGHAGKAKEYLSKASDQIKQAAEAANHHN